MFCLWLSVHLFSRVWNKYCIEQHFFYVCTLCILHRVHIVLALSAFLYFARKELSCWLAWWQVGYPSILLVQISRECTPPYLYTGISNLLQPAWAEVVLGQLSRYLASWAYSVALPVGIAHCTAYSQIALCTLCSIRMSCAAE
jgi:hypothetical protein